MPNYILEIPVFQYIRDDNVKIIRTTNIYSEYNFCGVQDRDDCSEEMLPQDKSVQNWRCCEHSHGPPESQQYCKWSRLQVCLLNPIEEIKVMKFI